VAAAKAGAARGPSAEDEVILAADTLVVADGEVLGKPANAEEARRMLYQLRGRSHEVLTGVVLRASSGMRWGGVVSTEVVIRAYADAEIDEYVARGEPFDKAGGYAVQDEVFRPVQRLAGCYLNVVGLPLCAVVRGLTALGVMNEAHTDKPPCRYCRAGAPLVSIRSAY
jgi:nucleoside triphosphate pyrophosphatase